MIRSILIFLLLTPFVQSSQYLQNRLKNANQVMSQQLVNYSAQSNSALVGSARQMQVQNASMNQYSQSRNQQLGFSQLNRMSFSRRDPRHGVVQVYELVDLQSLKKIHSDYYFVEEKNLKRLEKIQEDKELSAKGQIFQEKIHLEPDFEKQRLNLSYEFEVYGQGKLLLLETNKDFQVHEALKGFELLALELVSKPDSNQFFVEIEGEAKIHIKGSVALHSIGLTGEYDAYVPVAFATAHSLTHRRNLTLNVELSSGVRHKQNLHFANLFNPVTVHFRKGQKKSRAQTAKHSVIQVQPDQFKRKRTLINWNEDVEWDRPFLYRRHAAFASRAKQLTLKLKETDLLLSLEVLQGRKTLKQGIDFGAFRDKEKLVLSFHNNSENLKIRATTLSRIAGKKVENFSVQLPFESSEFQDNFYKVQLKAKEGQVISVSNRNQLQQFAKTRTSISAQRLELKDVKDLEYILDLEERSLVELSSVRCTSYDVFSTYRGSNSLRMNIVMYIRNTGSQFLKLEVPNNYRFVHGKISNSKFTPAIEGENTYLIPLKLVRKGRGFPIELSFDVDLNKGSSKSLTIPKPEVDVDSFRWKFWHGDVEVKFANENIHFELKSSDMHRKGYNSRKGTHSTYSNSKLGRKLHLAESQGFPRSPSIQIEVSELKQGKNKVKRDYSLTPFLFLLFTGFLFRLARHREAWHPWIRFAALLIILLAMEFYWFKGILFSLVFGKVSAQQHLDFLLFFVFFLIQYLSWDLLETKPREL